MPQSGFFDNDKPLQDYTDEEWHQFLYGEPTKVEITYKKLKIRSDVRRLLSRTLSGRK